MNARPDPLRVELTLQQRRSLPVCVYYSAKLAREVVVQARCYWLGLWLDWAADVRTYVERPRDPGNPNDALADFWVVYAGSELLLDVAPEAKVTARVAPNAWALTENGYVAIDESRGRITPHWAWGRRALLLGLEQAHPYAVAAGLQDGLKLTCSALLKNWPAEGRSVREACSRAGANPYVVQSAIFHLVRTGHLNIDWTHGISWDSVLTRKEHASQD